MTDADALGASRWRGQRGRVEVWYSSFTDARTGTAVWLHHELVSPLLGAAYAHGWIAVFRPDRAPVLERFGPEPWSGGSTGFRTTEVQHTSGRSSGRAGAISWELEISSSASPLYTFPRWAWAGERLPAAQVVSRPDARASGRIVVGDEQVALGAAVGAQARIYGRGNALSWGWLHADLGGGDVCEVVAAVSRAPGLRLLPPLALVRLRLDGRDLPRDPLLAAVGLRARLGRDSWSVRGRLGKRRIAITVGLPAEQTLDVRYVEPDGSDLVCRNSERADATIVVGTGPDRRTWNLLGTAHAEVGGAACS